MSDKKDGRISAQSKMGMIGVLKIQTNFMIPEMEQSILKEARSVKTALDHGDISMPAVMEMISYLNYCVSQDITNDKAIALFKKIMLITMPKYEPVYSLLVDINKISMLGSEKEMKEFIEKLLVRKEPLPSYNEATGQSLWIRVVEVTLQLQDTELSNKVMNKIQGL